MGTRTRWVGMKPPRKPLRLSKKKLFEHLAELGFEKPSLKAKYISDETYGPKSCIYIHTGSRKRRSEVEAALEKLGHKVCYNYSPGSGTIEVEVTYFKGTRWDE